jgi:hypothetical protein
VLCSRRSAANTVHRNDRRIRIEGPNLTRISVAKQ